MNLRAPDGGFDEWYVTHWLPRVLCYRRLKDAEELHDALTEALGPKKAKNPLDPVLHLLKGAMGHHKSVRRSKTDLV